MILLVFCVALQILCLYERLFHKAFNVFVNTTRSGVRKQADNGVLADYTGYYLGLLSLPLRLFFVVLDALSRNLILSLWILFIVGFLVSVSENSSSVLGAYVNTYNSGIGASVDLFIVKPLQLLDLFFRAVVPLFNAVAWAGSQIFIAVVVPFFGVHVDRIPAMVGDFGLMTAMTGQATGVLVARYIECGDTSGGRGLLFDAFADSFSNVSGAEDYLPFTRGVSRRNMQCIANTNYMTLDLMTPGIYARKTMMHLHYLATSSCTIMTGPFDIALYPFLDFNLYKSVHCFVNTLLHVVIALPILTHARCTLALDPLEAFSDLEKAVMCAPDWQPVFLIAAAGVRSLGRLVDNWLNIVLLVVEHQVGRKTTACAQTRTVGDVWDGVGDIFETKQLHLKVVGVSEAMFAITDGVSSAYHSMTDGASTVWAIGLFPFQINTMLGVAAVKYGEVFDPDKSGHTRTGLFGCRCLDITDARGAQSIQIACSSVPYQSNVHDNDEDYDKHTQHNVVFDSSRATATMTCSSTVIRVSSLRFSRKRFSTGRSSGSDSLLSDPFNTRDPDGSAGVRSHTADAALYIQPLCDGPRESCLPGIGNCFPWCMGLHVAGQRNQEIRMYNARKWDDFVTLTQLDCVVSQNPDGECAEGSGARVVNLDAQSSFQSSCGVSPGFCSNQDSSSTIMALDNLQAGPGSAMLYKRETHAMLRLSNQPFVTAGDVFLHQRELPEAPGDFELVVSRLYDNNRGSYSMQYEQLSLLSNRQTVRLKLCATEDGAFCHLNALTSHTIILPRSYVTSAYTNIAVSSEWAVHWAVNPENAIFANVLDFCSARRVGLTVTVASSYSRPRVWTLKTVRAASINPSRRDAVPHADENGLYSYMLVPDWVVFDMPTFDESMCDKKANFKIVDLEYINANNVLVTTLYTSMRNYRLDGTVCVGCDYEYKRYFLHPNRHDCVAPAEGDGALFTCWRHERMGMFEELELPPEIYGEFCPALRRMPYLGSLFAETALITVHSCQLVLDAMTTLIAAAARNAPVSDIFEVRMNKPTFHHTLDSGGSNLFDFEDVVECFDKAAFYVSDVVLKTSHVFAGSPAYAFIEPIFAGTAKIVQHTAGYVKLKGPLARQFQALQDSTSRQAQQISEVTLSQAKGKAFGFLSSMRAWLGAQASSLKVSLKLVKKVTVKSLVAGAKRQKKALLAAAKAKALQLKELAMSVPERLLAQQARARLAAQTAAQNTVRVATKIGFRATLLASVIEMKNVLVTTVAESTEEIERSYLDNLRVMCDGASQILGTNNALALTVRHACLLVPDVLQSMQTLLVVLSVDYAVMDCVCRTPEEHVRSLVIDNDCVGQMIPGYWRAWVLERRRAPADDVTTVCFSSMDVANARLLTAFDPVSVRLAKLTEAMQGLFNFVVVLVGMDTGECNDFKSPYMVSIMPEPADYFMPCLHTSDCRLRCYDEFRAFESALAGMAVAPEFMASVEVEVESKYFSTEDIENNRHLPPFEIIGIAELFPDECRVVCTSGFVVANRCIAALGIEAQHNKLGLAYYCIPADMTTYVYAYQGPAGVLEQASTWTADEVVREGFMLSVYKLGLGSYDDVLVVTEHRTSSAKSLYMYTAHSDKITLLQTEEFVFEKYNFVTDMQSAGYVLNSLDDVRVIPATSTRSTCDVFVVGTKVTVQYYASAGGTFLPDQSMSKVCLRKSIETYPGDSSGSARPLRVTTTDCTARMDDIFPPQHHPVCLNLECNRVLNLPKALQSEVQTDTFTSYAGFDRDNLTATETARLYPESIGASSLAQLIRYDASRPLYVTAQQVGVVNKKHVSPTAPRSSRGVRGVEDGSETIEVLVSGTVSSHRSWIQSIRFRMTPDTLRYGAKVFTSTVTQQTMDVHLQCSIDNCVGCQSNPWQLSYVDLQSKCFAASRCGIKKCVGTPVDMRKPMCNAALVLIQPLELFRVALHSLWRFTAQFVISIVEISKNRRNAAMWEFPDSELTEGTCMLKRTVVGTVSVFTASLGSTVRFAALVNHEFAQDAMRSDVMDGRWYARYFMSTTAMTNFISSLFMGPIYTLMSMQKVLSCGVNDMVAVVTQIADGQAPDRFTITAQSAVTARRERVTTVCLSQGMAQRMRELGLDTSVATEYALANEYVSIVGQLEQIGTSFTLGLLSVPVDAFFASSIGVVSTFMDWLQTIDWKHCSLPSVSNSLVFLCVCGDEAHRVASARRAEAVPQSAFWCSGPLLMTDPSGEERLVWNPYSLDALTAAEQQHTAFLACLSGGVSCDQLRPRLPALESQGVHLTPVITQCRDNYKNKQWDAGVLALGLFSVEEWRSAPSSLENDAVDDDTPSYLQLHKSRLRALSSLVEGFTLDEALWRCLNEAIVTGNAATQGVCLRNWIGVPEDNYFTYELTGSDRFSDIDACRSFSGQVTPFNAQNNAARSLIMWTGSSLNRVPVAERHEIATRGDGQRLEEARTRLHDLYELRIRPALQTLSLNVSESLRTNLWSMEGDELHQFLDCIVMGPYASADMHASFDLSGGGGRFEVPRYHRGSPGSRAFGSIELGQTQGSGPRRRIVTEVLEHVHSRTDDLTRTAAVNRVNLIRGMFSDPDNFECLCPNATASLECCSRADWTQIADIQFRTKNMFADIYNLQTDVVDGAMDTVLASGILDRIWTSSAFSHLGERPLTDEERMELSHAYVFATDRPVREYSAAETPESLAGATLWETCTSLISASFFTLPTTGGRVDADVRYNPALEDSGEYMHGMERVIHRILQRARRDSPVFWTHSHRYVASDSVWCEQRTDPSPRSAPGPAFAAQEWRGHAFGAEHVRASTLASTVFVGELSSACLCGWEHGGLCHIPIACDRLAAPAEQHSRWMELCSRGNYSVRGDLFDLMHLLQTSVYDLSELETCRDLVPDVVWGLLSPADHKAWYAGDTTAPPAVDLKHIATHGPAGVRLGLFAREGAENSLAAYIKTHGLLARDPRHPVVNHRLKHTIAQPVCQAGLAAFLRDDLSEYFQDVLFPMAHSVSDAPAAAYCSTWAIERTVELAMRQIYRGDTPDALLQQTQTVGLWRKRCDTQLKQIGICVLRGVYDLVPDGVQAPPGHCAFAVSASHGCTGVFYVTAQCVVRCDAEFYDPCLCSTEQCASITFAKATCSAGRLAFNPSTAVTDEATRLFSLDWPAQVPANEISDARSEELDALLGRIRLALPLVTFDDDTVMQSMSALITATEPGSETSVPHSHCDDLLDYFDEDAQHPVGYHPTCACRRSETRMRGFDSWMSEPSDLGHAWAVDPVRMRNMTQYSTSYGSAHLVCDAAVYGAYDHQLNGLDLVSRWDADAPADPAIPRAAPVVHEQDMTTEGEASGDQFDTPLVPAESDGVDEFLYSTGLVRDWLSMYGPDAALQAAIDAVWPMWDAGEPDAYGSRDDAVVDNCALPPLLLCLPGSSDCCDGTPECGLTCLTNAEDSVQGICARVGTCFQHRHCADTDKLCAGNGSCVAAHIYITNNMDTDVDTQLFSADEHSCARSGQGYSSYEGVSDFGQAHGMCSFRDWFHYQNITRNTLPARDSLLHVRDRLMHRTDQHTPQSLREAGTLKTQAHACDRSYQHTTLGLCHDSSSESIRTSYSYRVSAPDNERAASSTAIRTWEVEGEGDGIRFCDMGRERSKNNPVNGFLNPYEYEDPLTRERLDTLEYVPQTVGRCQEFSVCPDVIFPVQGLPVHARLVGMVERSERRTRVTSAFREYSHDDAEACFAPGYLVATDDKHALCVVDRMAVPLINVVFASADDANTGLLPFDTSFNSDVDSTQQWSQESLLRVFAEVRRHCPRAFSRSVENRRDFALYSHVLALLSAPYEPGLAAQVSLYANVLLPALFGIDTALNSDATRGFSTIEQYLELATCARYIDTRLRAVVSAVFRPARAYTTESVNQEQVAGDSLYLFHGRAAVYVPFRWFWQCVVLSTSSEHGAPQDWFRVMTDEDYAATSCPCNNYEQTLSLPMTVKRRLQTSAHIYTITDDIEDMAAQLAHDIFDTVGIALAQLGLPMFPDLYYMRRRPGDDCMSTNMFVAESCWEKFGRDAAEIVDPEELLRTPDGSSTESLYARMRHLLGFTAGDLHDKTLQDLEALGLVELQLSLQTVVLATTNFFPAIRFRELDLYHAPPTYRPVDPASVPPDYAQCGDPCDVYTLRQFEYQVQDGRTVEIDVYAGLARHRSVVTQAEAEYLLVQSFRRLIYFQTSFASNNVHVDSRTSNGLMSKHGTSEVGSVRAREYNAFMRSKSFRCTTSVAYHLASNQLHAALRQCLGHLRDDVGWQLPAGGVLHMEVPAAVLLQGFLASFAENGPEHTKYLEKLTSADWANSEHVSTFDVMCYQLQGETHTINPYWAVDYDVTSGCDTFRRDALRLIDGRCLTRSAAEQCSERFPDYHRAISERMPAQCRANVNTVATGKRGTLRPGLTELCDHTFVSPALCNLRHGSFAGATGESIRDTQEVHDVGMQPGLWLFSNSIFRGSVLRPANTPHIEALRLLPTDIAGHSLEFDIDAQGQLALKCVNLLGEAAVASCRVSNQHWMRNIEEHWAWQHARQKALWPTTQMRAAPVSWKCPLQWLQAYSGGGVPYTMRSPSRDRNRYRFRHITGPHDYAHPVASSTRAPVLMPGGFVSDTQSCAVDTSRRDVVCHSEILLAQSIAHARELIWRTVAHHTGEAPPSRQASCSHVLDWPHQGFHTWDEQTFTAPHAPAEVYCNVLDRLPRFQLMLAPRTRPRPHSGRTSVDRGGACRMGRLRRMASTRGAHEHVQYCMRGREDSTHCRYLDTSDPAAPRSVRREEADIPARARPAHQAFRKNTHCAACDTHKLGAFVHTDGSTHNLGGRPLMSTGEKVQISTARLLASYLRKLVCPLAATEPCPELLRVFDTSRWRSGVFLRSLLGASNTSAFYNSYYQDVGAPAAPAAIDDSVLWRRNWVWCEPGSAACRGSVSKEDWINPTTRSSSCKAAISQAAHNTSSRVHFCMIDSNTARLCQLVVEWNAEITGILCRLAGLPSCAEAGFFYNPTSYSSDNREFEHDTVRAFYASSSKTVCEGPSTGVLTQLQIESNTRLLSKCASVSLMPVLSMLRAARNIINMLVELLYYGTHLALNVVLLVVHALGPAVAPTKAIVDRIIVCINLILDTLKDIVTVLYQVVFKIVFGEGVTKVLVEILKAVCKIVQFIIEYPIKKGICPILRILADFMRWLNGIFQSIWSVDILGVRPFYLLEVTVGSFLQRTMIMLDGIIAVVCDMERLDCNFMDVEEESRNGPGTLPIVTRCWSTYVTFYGDGQSLACTKADTCRRSLTDNSLVVCGACPEADPPNPLTHHFGCDSITKSCTCATPKLRDTLCLSNQECELPGQSCGFLNTELEPAGALTLCETCTTRPLCYVPRGASVGQCSCGLFEIPFATCRTQDVGQLIALPFSKMCVLQPDARFRFSTSFSAEFGLALATPCMAVDASTSFCTRMVDLADAAYIVSTHTTHGRRLLEAVGSSDAMLLGANSTHNPVCKDALGSSADTHVRRMCVDLFVRSASTVRYLGLDASVPPCAFCSAEDLWNLMQLDPMIVPFLAVHPEKLLYVLFEHTGLVHARRLYHSLLRAVQLMTSVLAHANITDYIGVNITASGIVLSSKDPRYVSPLLALLLQTLANSHHAGTVRTQHNTTTSNTSTQNTSSRSLLSIQDLSRDVQREVARALETQRSYSAQISSAYSYNFPQTVSHGSAQWLESWPPTLGSSAGGVDGTCAPAYHIASILYYAASNATLFYTAGSRNPQSSLLDSFPHLQQNSVAATPLEPNRLAADRQSTTRNDPLLKGIMWTLDTVAEALGVRKTFFYDCIYSLFFELQQSVSCDLEALQTCSRWNVRMSNAVFVIGFYFLIWFLLLGAFKLEFVAALSVPFFWLMLLRLCYGYSWTCVPALPACLLEDVYTSVEFFFPKVLLLPQTLWLDQACADRGVVEAACLKTCQDSPFGYTSAQAVAAWVWAELGGSGTESILSALEIQTLVNIPELRRDILVKQKVIEDSEHGLITGHRLCATVGSYRLMPYLLVLLTSFVIVIFIVRSATAMLYQTLRISINNFISCFV